MLQVVEHSIDVLALLLQLHALNLQRSVLRLQRLNLNADVLTLLCNLSVTIQIRMVQMRLLGVHFRHYAVKLHLCLTLAGFILCPDFFLVHSSFVF